tara:strand:- start:15847 stop:16143 length:297 start_codon:yes stop_codon:yes gene_type:complete
MMSREEPPRPCKKSKEFKSMATRAMIEPVCRVVSQEGEFEIYRPSGHIHLCSSAGLMITLKANGTIKFNQEKFPDMAADEFAAEVIKIIHEVTQTPIS